MSPLSLQTRAVQILRIEVVVENQTPNRKNHRKLGQLTAVKSLVDCCQIVGSLCQKLPRQKFAQKNTTSIEEIIENWPKITSNLDSPITNPSDRECVASIVDTLTKQINQLSLRSSDYTPYTLISSTPREVVAVPADNSRWNQTAAQWEPNNTPWRTFTASVMLSDPQGYSGGSLRFHGKQAEASVPTWHQATGWFSAAGVRTRILWTPSAAECGSCCWCGSNPRIFTMCP